MTNANNNTKAAVQRFEQWEAVLASELPPFRYESKTYGTEYVTGFDCEYWNGNESFNVRHFVDSLPGEPDIWFVELIAGVPAFVTEGGAE